MNRTLILRAILIVSLACNVAMFWAFCTRPPMMPPHNAEEFLAHATHDMSAADATMLRQTFDKYQPALDDKRKAADEAMDNVRAELGNETVDSAALAAAIDKARAARGAYQAIFQDAIEDVAPRLSKSARMELMPNYRHDHEHEQGPGPNGAPPRE